MKVYTLQCGYRSTGFKGHLTRFSGVLSEMKIVAFNERRGHMNEHDNRGNMDFPMQIFEVAKLIYNIGFSLELKMGSIYIRVRDTEIKILLNSLL